VRVLRSDARGLRVVWIWVLPKRQLEWPIPTSEEEQKLKQWKLEGEQVISREMAIELILAHVKATRGDVEATQDYAEKLLLAATRVDKEVKYYNDDRAEEPRFDFAFRKDGLLGWLHRKFGEPQVKPAQQEGKRRGGRKLQFDWPAYKDYAFDLLNDRGDPEDAKNQEKGWRSVTDLAKAIHARMKPRKPDLRKPDLSTVRKYAAQWLAEWRKNCAQASNISA
jgi:hypothetical protein